MSEKDQRTTGALLNARWGVGAAHGLYIHDCHWYHQLRRFPGAPYVQTATRLSIGESHRTVSRRSRL